MAAAGTVRISESSHRTLKDLADREGAPMQTVLDRAIENYRRAQFLDLLNQSFADLKKNSEEWAAEQQERNEWDGTTSDGIEPAE